MTSTSTSTLARLDLGPDFGGRILRSGDDGWDDAVLVWNGLVTHRPAVVVQPASASDVALAVVYARDHDIELSVKGGGHHIAGLSMTDGGMTLDMSAMRDVDVDVDAELAHVGAGCLLQDVDRATQAHRLATTMGIVSEVGVAGLTLGGGFGYLARRFGWAADNLEEVEIVTADGTVRVASREQHADLFWAVRGGGGNFGVVTRFTFRLHEVGPTVYGGLIAWPFDRAGEVLRAYREITSSAPLELTVFMVVLHAPPAPFVPPELVGAKSCAFAVCYTGPWEDLDAAMAPIRAIGDPVVDLLREVPYTELQSMLDGTEPKGFHYYWKAEYATELPDPLLDAWRESFLSCPMTDGQLVIGHIGGTINDRPADDGVVDREVRYILGAAGTWPPDDEAAEGESNRRWVRDTWARFRPFTTGASYVNFHSDDDGPERTAAAYGANFERLQEVKAACDPTNLFRRNRNITPREPGAATRR